MLEAQFNAMKTIPKVIAQNADNTAKLAMEKADTYEFIMNELGSITTDILYAKKISLPPN